MFVTRLPALMLGLTACIPNSLGHSQYAIGETSSEPGPRKVPFRFSPGPFIVVKANTPGTDVRHARHYVPRTG